MRSEEDQEEDKEDEDDDEKKEEEEENGWLDLGAVGGEAPEEEGEAPVRNGICIFALLSIMLKMIIRLYEPRTARGRRRGI